MRRKDWPTDPAEIRRSIDEAIQDLVRKGLVVDRSEEMVKTDRPLRSRVGVYDLRQDVPLSEVYGRLRR